MCCRHPCLQWMTGHSSSRPVVMAAAATAGAAAAAAMAAAQAAVHPANLLEQPEVWVIAGCLSLASRLAGWLAASLLYYQKVLHAVLFVCCIATVLVACVDSDALCVELSSVSVHSNRTGIALLHVHAVCIRMRTCDCSNFLLFSNCQQASGVDGGQPLFKHSICWVLYGQVHATPAALLPVC